MGTWFVTGASRGLGAAIAAVALQNGHAVVAAARRPEQAEAALGPSGNLLAVRLDVTDGASITAAVSAAVDRFGSIDVLVNNAGLGLLGALEEISDAEARAFFDVNVFGVMNVTRAVLPTMRAQGHGRIVNMSSSAGLNGSAGASLYSSSKFAVEGLTESLDAELEPFGIRAVAIEPGGFRTDFLDSSSLLYAARAIPAYQASMAGRLAAIAGANHAQPGDPQKAAQLIYEVATSKHMPARVPVGADAISVAETKAHRVLKEIEPWRARSVATAHQH